MTLRERIVLVAMGIGAVLMIAATVFAYTEEKRLLENQAILAREFQDLDLLDNYAQALREVRRWVLNVLISPTPAYLEELEERLATGAELLASVEKAGGLGKPEQVYILLTEGRDFIRQYEQIISVGQTQGFDKAIEQVKLNIETGSTDRLLDLTEEMYRANLQRYNQLSGDIAESARTTMVAITVYIVLALILLFGSVSIMLHYYKMNQQLLLQSRELEAGLEEKINEQETIISIISHDLRAPLVNIEGFSHEIGNGLKQLESLTNAAAMPVTRAQTLHRLLGQSLPEALDFVLAGTTNMNRLIKNLVEFARAGRLPIQGRRVDMNEFIGQLIKDFEFRLKQLNADMQIGPLPACMGDALLLRQVFSNLIDNAIKYSEPSRPLRLELTGSADGNRCIYRVSDNGIGIEPENLDKVFSMYHQVRRKRVEGSGLGLAIAKKLIERSGGSIRAESTINQGSTFVIELPRAD